jgi:hypothetical protein
MAKLEHVFSNPLEPVRVRALDNAPAGEPVFQVVDSNNILIFELRNNETFTGGEVLFNAQTGTSYTLVLTDKGKTVSMTNASANTLTIPSNASVAFPVGTVITLRQGGAGQTTVNTAGGATVNSRGGALKLAGQYAYASLIKIGENAWELSGDITT